MTPLRGWARESPQYRSGNSESGANMLPRKSHPPWSRLNPSIQIREIPSVVRWVTRRCKTLWTRSLNPSIQIRAIPSKKPEIPLAKVPESQSLNTDQGNSEGTPSKALRTRGLSGLLFQPPREASDFRAGRARNAAREIRNPFKDKDFKRISNRCAKMAIWRWHDSCRAWILIFKEADPPRRRSILRHDPAENRVRQSGSAGNPGLA